MGGRGTNCLRDTCCMYDVVYLSDLSDELAKLPRHAKKEEQ